MSTSVLSARTYLDGHEPVRCAREQGSALYWEGIAEGLFTTGSLQEVQVELGAAREFCKGCPIAGGCLDNARNQGITGLAGGALFVNGRRRVRAYVPVGSTKKKDYDLPPEMKDYNPVESDAKVA
ncbi:Uncharacterised protein [Mycobacteroides abscessus subsp. abscessus]|uniref:hypothetical protein n=1 Tax=Mycobacteroides abscessus TaxID=36809 RepID=UPI00092747B5|nr:hypothetical protein [Mycobacteroides abscessus]SHU65042.1 Uncharacterised protein [Mycobacteroides abscessus subsp. abscessus]